MTAALWALLGGIGGTLRMLAAGATVAALGFIYVTIWMVPRAAEAARQGYVLEAAATAATARADELQRQIDKQRPLFDAYAAGYTDLLQKQAAQDAETEKVIALNENQRRLAGRTCGLDQSDIDFLRK
jgi:hypothetical protein